MDNNITNTLPENDFKFGHITIKKEIVFYHRRFVFAFTNLRPFVPGHILLCPVRPEKKFCNLTETEVMEMWISARNISDNLKKYYQTDSVNLSIQDGEAAGQTVEHCHIHLMPLQNNYVNKAIDDSHRSSRTIEEMIAEAEEYRKCFVFN